MVRRMTPAASVPVTIRPARPGDLAAVVDVLWEVGAEGRWIGTEVPFDRDERRQRLARRLAGSASLMLVAESGARVVGQLGVDIAPYGVADLGMALLEGWRGRGLGTAMLRQAIDWARSRGAHKMALEVWPGNQRAIALYRKLGFVIEGRKERHYRRANGEAWTAMLMGLPLREPRWALRPATDDDGWDLVALVAACWSEYPGCVMDPHGECPELLAPASAYRAGGGAVWVVDGPATLVASVALAGAGAGTPTDSGSLAGAGPVAELQKLYVSRRWRRQGLGRYLVGVVEDEARRRGAGAVQAWSDTRFGDAHRLYAALGYRRLSETRALGDRSATVEARFVKFLNEAA